MPETPQQKAIRHRCMQRKREGLVRIRPRTGEGQTYQHERLPPRFPPLDAEVMSQLDPAWPDPRAICPHCKAERDETVHRIRKVLRTLTYRERTVLSLRYGIGYEDTYTLEEVGRIVKITRERVRQVEAKAIRKLQHPIRAAYILGRSG